METMTKEEKLEIITEGVAEASSKLYEIKQDLKGIEDETGYKFSYQIMQELEDGYMSGLRRELEDICNGDKNEQILEELEDDEEEKEV